MYDHDSYLLVEYPAIPLLPNIPSWVSRLCRCLVAVCALPCAAHGKGKLSGSRSVCRIVDHLVRSVQASHICFILVGSVHQCVCIGIDISIQFGKFRENMHLFRVVVRNQLMQHNREGLAFSTISSATVVVLHYMGQNNLVGPDRWPFFFLPKEKKLATQYWSHAAHTL